MLNTLLGQNNNILTTAFTAATKTIVISGMTVGALDVININTVYNTTHAGYFGKCLTCTQSTASGNDVYTFTFATVPASSADGDTLKISLTLPNDVVLALYLQKISTGTA